jgi:hypothetical protein
MIEDKTAAQLDAEALAAHMDALEEWERGEQITVSGSGDNEVTRPLGALIPVRDWTGRPLNWQPDVIL